MAYFVVLVNFTDQGAKAVRDTAKRADAYKATAEKAGVKVNHMLWTLGCHDVVIIAEAADDATMTALNLSIASLGNVRSQTLRAFDASEIKSIIGKMS
ncbi:hypothetical protein LMIY3S_00968 [Labrys miyagiensis]